MLVVVSLSLNALQLATGSAKNNHMYFKQNRLFSKSMCLLHAAKFLDLQ